MEKEKYTASANRRAADLLELARADLIIANEDYDRAQTTENTIKKLICHQTFVLARIAILQAEDA